MTDRPASASHDPHQDATDFLAAVGGDRLVREMVALFVAYTPQRIAAMHDASGRQDARGLRREAFALRAAAMQLGLCEVERVAATIERDAGGAHILMADLEHAYADAVRRLIPPAARVA